MSSAAIAQPASTEATATVNTTPTKQKSKSTRKASEKDKDKDGDLSKEEKADRLKTVVRRLPPTLPEEIFWQSVQPWVTDQTVSWKVYHPGKVRKRPNKESIPSRAYIAFKTEEQLANFSQAYDGHLFRDKAGNEFIAVVEFAPYQKIPTEKKKADARCNTIDKDEDFISFLKSLDSKGSANGNDEPSTLEQLIAASQPPPQPKTTPLLEALKAQKEKESATRIQIHTRDHANATLSSAKDGGGSKKDTEKKGAKGAKAVPPAAAESGKKGKKAKAAAASNANTNASAAQGKVGPSGGIGTLPPAASPKKPAPKAPHPARLPSGQQPSTTTVPTASISQTPSEVPATVTSAGREAAQPRRARPVIASRGFEAALTGAGVAVNKRKAKEKADRESAASASVAGPSDVAPAVDAAKEKEIQARKDKDRERERKRREKERQEVLPKAGDSPAPTPAILTRDAPPKILARPPANDGSATQSQAGVLNVKVYPSETEGGGTGGGATRGVRRGRGRGGKGRGGG